MKDAHDQGEDKAIPYLEAHRSALRRAREVGITDMFVEIGCPAVPASERGINAHPLFRLAQRVLQGSLALEEALQQAGAADMQAQVDEEALLRLDDHVQGWRDDWQRVEESRVLAELNRAAAQARPAAARLHALCATTLGDVLGRLIPASAEQQGQILERCIELYREALPAWERLAEAERSRHTWNGLGLALLRYYDVRREAAGLDQAVAAFEQGQALAASARDRERSQTGLGNALLRRFEARHEVADLDRAIVALEQVLDLAEDALERSRGEASLGAALRRRFAARAQMADLDRAIAALRKGLAIIPTGSADWVRAQAELGQALQVRLEVSGQAGDRNLAIQAYEEMLAAIQPEVFPEHVWATALPLARLLFRRQAEGDWRKAADVYAAGRLAAGILYLEVLPELGHGGRSPHLQEAITGQAYALARAGDYAAAAEAVEAGCIHQLAELALGEQAVEHIPDRTWREAFVAAWRRVCKAAGEHDRADEERSAWAQARLVEARLDFSYLAKGLFPDLFAAPTLETIRMAAGESPLVYLAVTSAGGVALAVSAGGVEPAWFDLTAEDVGALLRRRAGDGGQDGYLPAQTSRPGLEKALDEVLPLLGEKMMGTVASALTPTPRPHAADTPLSHKGGEGERGRALTLIPTGLLALLPLPAARYNIDGREVCFLDEFAVAYAPAAQTLAAARKEAEQRGRTPWRLAGLDDPTQTLSQARAELEAIAGVFPGRPIAMLMGVEGTRGALLAALSEATVAHLVCPARFELVDPLASELLLAGRAHLTLRDLLRPAGREALSRLRLAVLSAGQALAVATDELPDQALGLSEGLLRTGVPAVVSARWAVDEHSRVLLLLRFYELMVREQVSPAAALQQAQCWLRDLTYTQILSYLEGRLQVAPAAGEGMAGALWMEEVSRARQALQEGRGEECPYAAPYHWATFSCFGA